MVGTVVHLVVADKIIRRLPEGTIKNTALFYCGSLAPDASSKKWVIDVFLKDEAILDDSIHSNTEKLLEFAEMTSAEIIRRGELFR